MNIKDLMTSSLSTDSPQWFLVAKIVSILCQLIVFVPPMYKKERGHEESIQFQVFGATTCSPSPL